MSCEPQNKVLMDIILIKNIVDKPDKPFIFRMLFNNVYNTQLIAYHVLLRAITWVYIDSW